ncbi:MAG: CDC48 family AAA ATPase [archaeon]
MADEIELIVAEASQNDVGKGIARISPEFMSNLSLKEGDIISISGKMQAVASAWKSKKEDIGLDIIRIDSTIRTNAGTSLNEKVNIKKLEVKAAAEITFSPLYELPNAPVLVKTYQGVQKIPLKEYLKYEIQTRFIEKPFQKGNKISINILGTSFQLAVKNVAPKGAVKLAHETKLTIADNVYKEDEYKIPEVSYEDIGGLHDEIDAIREMVELPMKHPEVFERLGIGAPKGVLLYGPPGTGKTLLAKAVASETESTFYYIAGPEIMSKFYGESEKALREKFEEAEKNAPSIIFIDEIDAIAPKREEVTGEMERRIVAQLLTLMDGLKGRGQVVVIAATNRQESIDPALRRPGRFDREISINVPNKDARKEILQIHTRGMPLFSDVSLDKLSDITIGYTGADLRALCKEAAMKSLKNYIPSLKKIEEKVPENVLEKINIKMEHFMDAFRKVMPSAMREVLITKPTTKWEDIGGLESVKQKMIEAIEWPLSDPESFKKAGIKPPKGILLYGPPGCGKTLLAKAVANECNANFLSVKGPELISKWVGESEKHMREIFKKARQVAPSIIFFDEFDSISQVRGSSVSNETERVVNQLLTELDGIEELEKVIVIAATNRPDLIDPGLLRPGRIDLKVEIPSPDEKARLSIFKVHTKNMPLEKSINLEPFAKETEGLSGAEIESVCREAGMDGLRQSRKSKKDVLVTKKNIETALNLIKENSGRLSFSKNYGKENNYIQ